MASYYESSATFRPTRLAEDVDPMTSMSGIGDVMLVFACGLMTALIIAWSVDLGKFSQVELGDEVQDIQMSEEAQDTGEGSYIEMGTVYMDAETGQYYLVENE